jgi:hypothetical protein
MYKSVIMSKVHMHSFEVRHTGIKRGKNSRKPSGGMLTSQYADLKYITAVITLHSILKNIKGF